MAREYYYLIAGLPDLLLDQEQKDFNLINLKNEIKENIHPNDYKLVELLFLEYDNQNFLNYLFERSRDFSPLANYPQELYVEFEENVNQFPEYIQKFYASYKGKDQSDEDSSEEQELAYSDRVEKVAEVQFHEKFFDYINHSGNRFLKEWFSFLTAFNNTLAAINSRNGGIEVAPHLVGHNEFVETLARSQAADFGLKKEVSFLEPLLQIADQADIVERERRLDLLKWDMVDELTTFDYFNIHKILAFLVKAGIVYRWSKLDNRIGAQMLDKLVSDIRHTYELPKEFEN